MGPEPLAGSDPGGRIVKKIPVERCTFVAAILAFPAVFLVSSLEQWFLAPVDPTVAAYLLPFGLAVLSFGLGSPLSRRSPRAIFLVDRFYFWIGLGAMVLSYAAGAFIGNGFDPSTGVGYTVFPTLLIVPFFLFILSLTVPGAEAFPNRQILVRPEPRPGGLASKIPRRRRVPTIYDGDAPDSRRENRAVVLLCVLGLAGTLVLWTGFVPFQAPTRSIDWTMDAQCDAGLSDVEHSFPLWAGVHFSWSTNGSVVFLVSGLEVPLMNQVGTNGSGSFVSNANPVVFAVGSLYTSPFNCSAAQVTLLVSYSA
jgi:hypothetical protein